MRRIILAPLAAATLLALAACNENQAPPPAAQAPLPPTAGSVAAGPAAALVEPLAPTPAVLDWNNLDAAVGKYSGDIDLFGTGPVADAIRSLAGNRFATLRANLAVAGPLQKSRGVYYITGNAPHQGGVDQAYVLIDPRQQALEIGLWRQGVLDVTATPGASIAKPEDVTTMMVNSVPAAATTAAH